MKIAEFEIIDGKKVFKSVIDGVKIGDKYHLIANSTDILPDDLPNENQFLVLQNEKWVLFDKKVDGTFYNKQDGSLSKSIFQKDYDNYTNITPLTIDDNSKQKFNDEKQLWEYVFIDEKLALKIAKEDKTKKLKDEYDISKNITLQDKNYKIIITAKTPERMHFVNLIETLKQEDKFETYLKVYQQKEDNHYLTISATSYIWSYIFQDLFVKRTGVDFFENARAFNKISFNIANDKINNANTIDEVNNISWEFESKNGIIIDINEKAKKMLDDPNFDYKSKDIIKRTMDKDGNINLIKKIDI